MQRTHCCILYELFVVAVVIVIIVALNHHHSIHRHHHRHHHYHHNPNQALVSVKSADISAENLVVRFSEAVDGFPLPKGHSENPDLQAPQKPGAEAFLNSESSTSSERSSKTTK